MREFVEKIKTFYDKGLYTEEKVIVFYEKGKITEEELNYILGKVK